MAGKLETAREYVLANYNNGEDFRWDVLSRKLQIRSIVGGEVERQRGGEAERQRGGEAERQRGGEAERQRGGEAEVWKDCDTRKINSIACDCAAKTGVNVTDREIRIVLNSENIPSVNPLRDYLNHLEPYNPDENGGHSWINWLSAQVRVVGGGKAEGQKGRKAEGQKGRRAEGQKGSSQPSAYQPLSPSAYQPLCPTAQAVWKHCFKKWFVAMVASWLYDEVVNQEVLVLIGRQGIYKTTWLERLLPPCLRAYGTKMSNPHDLNKDEVMRIAEFGLICIDELDALNKQELNKMKSLITRSDVNERAAYAYTKERRTRIASFCGSGNESQILTDDTGNRRWLIFDVESIENPFAYDDAVFPYAQIYGEALYLIANHFNYWFDLEDIKTIEEQNESHRKKNNEEDLLPVYFAPANPGDAGALFLSTSEISQRLRDYGSIAIPMPINNLGRVLQRMGFVPRKSNGRQGYVVYAKQDLDSQRKLDAHSATDL